MVKAKGKIFGMTTAIQIHGGNVALFMQIRWMSSEKKNERLRKRSKKNQV